MSCSKKKRSNLQRVLSVKFCWHCCCFEAEVCWGSNEGFYTRTSFTTCPLIREHPQLQLQRDFLPGADVGAQARMTKLLRLPGVLLLVINDQYLYAFTGDNDAPIWERACNETLHVNTLNENTISIECRSERYISVLPNFFLQSKAFDFTFALSSNGILHLKAVGLLFV